MDFQSYPLWVNAVVFACAAALVWVAGTKLSRYVDIIATAIGLDRGFAAMLLLGGITSLPEVATVTTASVGGAGALALNNLLGSFAINVVLLAVADAMIGRDALTSTVAHPSPMLQGILSIVLLALVAAGTVTGDVLVAGVGLWSALLVPTFLFAMWLAAKYGRQTPWVLAHDANGHDRKAPKGSRDKQASIWPVAAKLTAASAVVLIAGYALASTGDAIAHKTGIGSNLVGLVLVGFATSLPEVSSIYGSVRRKRYEMAIGEIFGTNLWDLVLIFLIDVIYAGDAILNVAGPFETFATLLGMVLTSLYLIGLLERRDRTIARMGYDSLAVMIVYAGGLGVLWFLRGISTG